MERTVRDKKPFFVYYPMTQIHFPTLAHPDFAGKTGAGDIGDAMAELDYNVGLMLDAIDRLGIRRNTIVLWCTDNGAEGRRPWRGSAGPWAGFYNSVMEGGIRTPCLIRWPERIPAGRVTNELVHEIDLFPTLAAAAGADVPRDRAIDGVNQLPFFEGKQAKSSRESVLLHANAQLRAVKWHDWKLHYVYAPEAGGPAIAPLMRLFNLLSDPKEETDVKDANPWVQSVTDRIANEFTATVQRYPHVPVNAPDPYSPPNPLRDLAVERREFIAMLASMSATVGAVMQPPVDFSGQWTLQPPKIALPPAVPGTPAAAATPGDLGSGWGTTLTIAQDAARLSVAYQIFSRYDLQPPVTFTYPLDGSIGRNTVMMGRGEQVESSRARWDGQTLIVTTTFQVDARDAGKPLTAELTRKLWLESPTTLIVEATHTGVLGGPGSTTRSIYRKD
jgi:hypothetical protein